MSLKNKIKNPEDDDWSNGNIFFILSLFPELVKECDVEDTLMVCLGGGFYIRNRAAAVLHQINHPLGILHLTYDVLNEHPQWKDYQKSDYHDVPRIARQMLLPYAKDLTDECIDLLIEDLFSPQSNGQIDILAMAPTEKVVDKMLPYLKGNEIEKLYAAYILAMHDNNMGQDCLIQVLKSEGRYLSEYPIRGITGEQFDNARDINAHMYIYLALIGLCHIPDKNTIKWYREYIPRFQTIFKGTYFCDKHCINSLKYRLEILESKSQTPVLDFLIRYSSEPVLTDDKDKLAKEENCNRLFPNKLFFNFLTEFASQEERDLCADYQRKVLLKLGPLSPENMHSYFLPGVPYNADWLKPWKLKLCQKDIERAATNWLLHPEHYNYGILPISLERPYIKKKISFLYRLLHWKSLKKPKSYVVAGYTISRPMPTKKEKAISLLASTISYFSLMMYYLIVAISLVIILKNKVKDAIHHIIKKIRN